MTTPAKPTVSVRTWAIASSTVWMLSAPPTRRVTSISAWTRRMAWTSSMDTPRSSARPARDEAVWPDRLPGFGDPRAVGGRPFALLEAPLVAGVLGLCLGLLELAAERAQQRPGDEERSDDQERDADGEVHVDAMGARDVLVRRAEAHDGQDDPVEQEEAADDAADVEQRRRPLLAGAAALLLGVLRLVDQLVAGAGLGLVCHGGLPSPIR